MDVFFISGTTFVSIAKGRSFTEDREVGRGPTHNAKAYGENGGGGVKEEDRQEAKE
jgi:hypothetical protein